MFIEALFLKDRNWKQPNCPSIEEWIQNMWQVYTMEYYSSISSIDSINFAGKWMELRNKILRVVT